MTIASRSGNSPELEIGAAWILDFDVTDADGEATADTVVITVSLPNATTATPTVEEVSSGRYRAVYIVASAGRYTARAVGAAQGSASVAAFVSATLAAAAMPDVDDALNYLGKTEDNAAGDVAEALEAEAASQRATCDVGAVYPRDLRHALFRRIARNIAMKKLPIPVQSEQSASSFLPGRDPEVRRLEGPHRRLMVG